MTEDDLKKLEFKKLGNTNLSLEDYKDLYTKGLKLLENEAVPKDLLIHILDDYQNRLDKMPAVDLSVTNLDQLDEKTREQVRSLILFGTQAALIKENAVARSEMERANQNYRDLLSVITHEFKNALTSIYGYNRIIKKRLEENSTENVLDINKNVDRLTRGLFGLVETLFSMSLLEQDKLEIERKIFDIYEEGLKPILSELELRLEQKSMHVKVDMGETKNLYYGDERFFQLVFRNLIQNAIQYGYPHTEIEIGIHSKDDEMILTIMNQGSGLAESKLNKVFEKFSRFHANGKRTNVGIGLFTVKSIIELHQGKIQAESEPEKWMKFTIRLPLDLSQQK